MKLKREKNLNETEKNSVLTKWKSWWTAYSGKQSRHPILAILLSVLLAFVLWFYVQDAESPNRTETYGSIPVKITGLAEDLEVIQGDDRTVEVTLRGKRSDLNRVKKSDIEAALDLSTYTEMGKEFYVDVSVLLPNGTEIEKIEPSRIQVKLDRTVSKTVPIEVELGEYTVAADTEIVATPAVTEIDVKGPQTVLNKVSCAKISVGDLGVVRQSFERTIAYELQDEDGNPITDRHLVLPEKNIRVTFSVNLVKTVPLVVTTANGYWADSAWSYTTSPSTVMVKGEPDLMAGVTEIAALKIDEKQFDGNELSQKVAPSELILPQGVTLAETMSDVNVEVKVRDNAVRNLRMLLSSDHVAVTPPEAEDGTELAYSFDVDAITLRVRGSAGTINLASENDFFLVVDLSSFATTGTREVPVEVVQTSATEGKYYVVGTYKLKVTVSSPEL